MRSQIEVRDQRIWALRLTAADSAGRFCPFPEAMSLTINLVRRLRPAPIGVAAAFVFGLSKRRVVNTKHGRFLLNPVSRLGYCLMNGEFEPSTTSVLGHYLKPGSVFIDLGANEG